MKRNLKVFLFIAVCAIAGSGLLYVKEYSQRQQINSETDENGNTCISHVQKRNKAYF